jgi:transcriptional regulator with XRE-family HTH domain
MRRRDQADLFPEDGADHDAELIRRASDAFSPAQADLARRMGVAPSTLTRWRSGKRTLSAEMIRRMAQELRAQSDELRRLALRLEARADRRLRRGATPGGRGTKPLELSLPV